MDRRHFVNMMLDCLRSPKQTKKHNIVDDDWSCWQLISISVENIFLRKKNLGNSLYARTGGYFYVFFQNISKKTLWACIMALLLRAFTQNKIETALNEVNACNDLLGM